ncbi:MAG: DUF3313 family protein [Myxococcales bacterium]|nr:DUF3313 family protein [Myxococcales bacterium]
MPLTHLDPRPPIAPSHPVIVTLIAALLVASGCATPPSTPSNAQPAVDSIEPFDPKREVARIMMGPMAVVTQDGLHMVEANSPGAIFVKAPHPNLYSYNKIMLAPVAMSYKATSQRRRSNQELEIGRHIRAALVRELAKSAGWELVRRPAKDVLRVRLSILELDILDPAPPSGSAITQFVASSGRVTLVMDLRDSLTDQPLLRFVERGALPGGFYSDPSSLEVDRVKNAVDGFAFDTSRNLEMFHNHVQKIREAES